MFKNIACTVGHSILKNGSYTSADGRDAGGVNEYLWCKKFVPILVKKFNENGANADLIICPEKKFSKAYEEKQYKLNIINNKKYDLVIESHLNCYNSKAKGTETLYSKGSKKGEELAKSVNDKLDDIFIDRGIKARDDLYILTQTKPVAILNEYFFCDNKEDYSKADEEHEMELIAEKVVEAVLGKSVTNSNMVKTFKNGEYKGRKARVTASTLNVRYDRGTNYHIISKCTKNQIVDLGYCLNGWVALQGYKGNKGFGYVSVDYLELI